MQKDQIIVIYKNEGETPLECLDRLRLEQPVYNGAILSYAGRLDPMAEGLLLVLVDEENKNREKYLGFDKEYEIEVLLGVSTDTGDVLGRVKLFAGIPPLKGVPKAGAVLDSFLGHHTEPYPSYSSKPVNGKPLFEWAREGRLNEIEIPVKEFEIYNIEQTSEIRRISKNELLKKIKERISKVKGDFRQEEIIKSWEENLMQGKPDEKAQIFYIIPLTIKCSSGAYMRTLAENMALKLGTVGIAWKIKRTQIGVFE